MASNNPNGKRLKKLLPRGSQVEIAAKIGITKGGVSLALDALNPNHPAVKMAVRIIKNAGTAETMRDLQQLLALTEPVAPITE